MLADIRLQLARYAQGIHWVQKNFLLDESISVVLVTAGPMTLSAAQSCQTSHIVLQMQPDFNTPFPAPESWNQQVWQAHSFGFIGSVDHHSCKLTLQPVSDKCAGDVKFDGQF